MKSKKEIWNVVWKVIKFILTIGLSHITKREEREKQEEKNNNNNNDKE